jgi:hypothetical protein
MARARLKELDLSTARSDIDRRTRALAAPPELPGMVVAVALAPRLRVLVAVPAAVQAGPEPQVAQGVPASP